MIKTRNAAPNKYRAQALPVRARVLLWPLYPVSQQIARISLSLLLDENTIRKLSYQRTMVAQSGARRTVTGIVALAWGHEKNRT